MHIVVHSSLAEINAAQWNSLLPDNNPFLRHEFLYGLEKTGCVTPDKGWVSSHITAYSDSCQTLLLGAMPCYIKTHSYGEYIFDWAWADAHYRHGLEYYPKMSNAVPFTPATGERILVADGQDKSQIAQALVARAIEVTEDQNLSSFHSPVLH